ncbi:MAG: glycosyl hydrolase family 2, partial [Candidatus Hydrogenedentes bacterium]|nr:glycosyl hydrolase family 2 [Candidatus Hydrogenedentota bacterium]
MSLGFRLLQGPVCLLALWCFTAYADDCGWPTIDPQHRPGAYWHWMASAVDEANLTRELETFHAAGLGGMHIVPIYGAKGYEDRYVEYLSPRWMELLAHTVKEANRLGMWIDMTTGTGWNFGGPNIPDDMANAVVKAKIDVAVAGQPSPLSDKGEHFQAVMAFGDSGQSVDLLAVLATGKQEWTPPDGEWSIVSVSQEPSGTVVERAAPGGEGWMLNLFQGGVVKHYLERFDSSFTNFTGPMPR